VVRLLIPLDCSFHFADGSRLCATEVVIEAISRQGSVMGIFVSEYNISRRQQRQARGGTGQAFDKVTVYATHELRNALHALDAICQYMSEEGASKVCICCHSGCFTMCLHLDCVAYLTFCCAGQRRWSAARGRC